MVQIMSKGRGTFQEEYEEAPVEMIKREMHNNLGLDLFLLELMCKARKSYELRELDSLKEIIVTRRARG